MLKETANSKGAYDGTQDLWLDGVDWEARVDFDRLRRERLARIKGLLKQSNLGALLCFDMNNVRYITATHIAPGRKTK